MERSEDLANARIDLDYIPIFWRLCKECTSTLRGWECGKIE